MTDLVHSVMRAIVFGLPWAIGVLVVGMWASLRFFKRGG